MAELELTVKYQTLPNKVGFTIMSLLFPIWALFVPFCLGLFIDLVIQAPGAIAPWLTFTVMSIMAAIPILGILLTAVFEDNRLYITKSGISFPLYMLPLMKFRRHRSWAELLSAGVGRTEGAKSVHPDRLRLHFDRSHPVEFSITNFDKVQLEQLLLATELWGARSARTPELQDFQTALQNENKGLGKLSQIQVWEEELSRRFNATSFVPLEPGRELMEGQIKVVRQLAFGGLSAIYLAQHKKLDMIVLKEAVVPSNADEETKSKAEEHFVREAKLLMKLDHPHIVQVLSHFQEDGRDYMVMEYLQGQDLRQHIKQHGPQPEHTVANWALQVADIMKFLHQQDPPIVHRDLTPDNLILDRESFVALIDFGAANQFVGTATGTLVGKQAYIAPEQLRGKATVASDVYSFGGTLYYWLLGKDPLPLASSHPMNENKGISIEMDELIAQMTAFDQNKRLTDWDTITEKLKEIQVEARKRAGDALPGGV